MSVIRSISRLVVLGAVLSPLAQSQLSTSTNYKLADFVLDAGGGGAASANYGGWATVGTITGGRRNSLNYQGNIGFLQTSDPIPANDPILFGITPDFGNKTGGSSVTLSGWNFNKFGVGPSLTMSVGGNPATGISVLTNTLVTATVPAGSSGQTGVGVTTSLGAGSDPDMWVYTPAVLTTANTQVGGEMYLKNYGTLGNSYITLVSASAGSGGTAYGTFLLGSPFIILFFGVPYPGPDGIHNLHVNVPNNPILSGLTVHFQSLEATQLSPVLGQFTNASTVTFQ